MRSLYRYLSMAVATGVIIQAAAIAWGVFGLAHDTDAGVIVDKNYEGNFGFALHSIIGWMVLPIVGLAFLLVGIALRSIDGALKWAGIVFGLVVLQLVLAGISFGAPVVGLLHGVNAILILLASLKAIYVVPKAASAVEA